MDMIVSDESPAQISDKLKDMLYAKSAEKVETARPIVANSLFGDQELEDEIKEFNIKISNKQKEISKFNNKAKIEFSNKLRLILEDFSNENSIAMIIRKENLLIGKSNLDVTKNILDLLNKKVKEIKVN